MKMGQMTNYIKKTLRYAKKNGVMEAVHTANERRKQLKEVYSYQPPTEAELRQQREHQWKDHPKISILVPAYETRQEYLVALLQSVAAQTYGNWELVIADASKSNIVSDTVRQYAAKHGIRLEAESESGNAMIVNEADDESGNAIADETDGKSVDALIRYVRLRENDGISGNTNEGLKYVTGEYTALLDHDDLLTSDALYELAAKLEEKKQENPDAELLMVYSDEDKCNAEGADFNCPHRKQDFNLDLFLTNNYICHFTMVRTEVIRQLKLRKKHDGAQDYDLFLRVVILALRLCEGSHTGAAEKRASGGMQLGDMLLHVPKILYHWRCHELSTADNPESKLYAYEAGLRAVNDFYQRMGWELQAVYSRHLGFYETKYDKEAFCTRADLGVIAGKMVHGSRVTGGAMDATGKVIYGELPRKYSGYMNRAALNQEVPAGDIRCMKVRQELRPLYLAYLARIADEDPVALSLEFCGEVRQAGFKILYTPSWEMSF